MSAKDCKHPEYTPTAYFSDGTRTYLIMWCTDCEQFVVLEGTGVTYV